MKVTIEKISPVKRNLLIEESSEVIDIEEKKIISEIAFTHRFPGFRKGKVPYSIVRKMFGDDIAETSLNSAIENLSRKAVEQEKLVPIGGIEEKNVKIENGMLSFTITFEVQPEIEDYPLETLEVEKSVYSVSEKLVNERLDLIRERCSFLTTAERSSAKGDFIQCDISARDENGGEIPEISFKDKMISIEEDYFWKGFPENMIGRNKNDAFSFSFMIPEEDHKYGGKNILFDVVIKEIKEKTVPELDDDLAKEFNYSDVKEMKSDVENKLREELKAKSDEEFYNNVLRTLEDAYVFEVPSAVIDKETEDMLDLLTHKLKIEKNKENLKSEISETAKKRAKGNMILDHLSQKLSVDISDEELRESLLMEISNEVGYDKLSRPAIKSKLNDSEFVRRVYLKIRRTKTFEKIIQIITVKEVRENEPE